MEWDEVETSELFRKFESLATTKLTEIRQKHWKECTAAITDVRQMINQLRTGFEEAISKINSDKNQATKDVTKYQEIIKGKNLELLGLRRQLRSYNLSKNICQKCDCEIFCREGREDKECNSQIGRKRARLNLSSSFSDPLGDTPEATGGSIDGRSKRPSEKRLCLATPNGPVAVEVNKHNSKSVKRGGTGVQSDSLGGSPESLTLTDGTVTNAKNDVVIKSEEAVDLLLNSLSDPISRPFGLSALSPPSTYYDASAAIHGAVNHLDLANYEPSIIATPSQFKKQSKTRSGGNKGHIAVQLHKKTCRHYQSPRKRTIRLSRPPLTKDLLSDVTGADLTFPSISTITVAVAPQHTGPHVSANTVDADPALMPPLTETSTRITRRASKQGCVGNLPSLGGSPTAQRKPETQPPDAQANPSKRHTRLGSPTDTKGPLNQCKECKEYLQSVGFSPKMIQQHLRNTTRHTHLTSQERRRSSFLLGTAALSTPQNFWPIENLSPPKVVTTRKSSSRSSQRPDMGVAVRRPRRRRPLEMSKRSKNVPS